MRIFLITTALATSFAVAAAAQTLNSDVDLMVGTTLQASGMSSSASLGVSGFGAGGVVVSNSGLDISLVPEGYADFDGSFIDGGIDVTNSRSVEVSGVLTGLGQIVAVGTTTSLFDASMIAGASNAIEGSYNFGQNNDVTDEESYESAASGLARASGDSTSSASMLMVGQTTGFIGQLGTTVGGRYSVQAGFGSYGGEYYDGGFPGASVAGNSGLIITAETDDINLAIANLGGGTMVLEGANSDLFEGATLLTNKAMLSGSFFDYCGIDCQ